MHATTLHPLLFPRYPMPPMPLSSATTSTSTSSLHQFISHTFHLNSSFPISPAPSMADVHVRDRDRDRDRPHQLQVHSQSRYDPHTLFPHKPQSPSAAQILAVLTLLPIGASLLALAGITLGGTFLALALATPLFLLFSPVLLPAAILLAGAVTGILTSGAFGLTGLSSLSWVLNSFRQATGRQPLDYAKRRLQETARQAGELVGEKTKQSGEMIEAKAQEAGGGVEQT